MSTIIVEDGSNVSGSNSYVALSDVNTYVTTLGADPAVANNWGSLTSDQQGEAVLVAGQYLERMFRWYGVPYYPSRPVGGTPGPASQSLQWPRTKNFDAHGGVITAGTIPAVLKQAQILLTLEFCQDTSEGLVTIEDVSPLKSMALDDVRMDFMSSAQDSTVTMFSGTRYPYIEFLLKNIGIVRDDLDLEIRKTDNQY